MAKAQRRRQPIRTRRSITSAAPVQLNRLVRGWSGPDGSRVRLARPAEASEVDRLLKLTGEAMDPAMVEAIATDVIAFGIRSALAERGSPTEPLRTFLVRGLTSGESTSVMAGLSTVLVAEDRAGDVIGALFALPPAGVIAAGVEGGVPPMIAMSAALTVVKIKGVAVAERVQGRGHGAELLKRAWQLYLHLDYYLAYGQFKVGTGLERYYPRRGFEVLAEGEGVSLQERLGVPLGIRPEPGERLFARWR